MPKDTSFAVVLRVYVSVELVSKKIAWWMKPRVALALFFLRVGCWLSNAEIDVKNLPPMKERVASINVENFMKDEPGSIRSKYGDLG